LIDFRNRGVSAPFALISQACEGCGLELGWAILVRVP
jgi:hypothetical protein